MHRTNSRWTSAVRAVAVSTALVLAASASVAASSASAVDAGGQSVASAEGDGGTLVIAARKTPGGVDHDFNFAEEDHQIRSALNENLLALGTQTDENGLVVPSYDPADLVGRLAESWELSNDGQTITIKLREGVMSHAGNELTAEDVQYTWDRSWALEAVGYFYSTNILLFEEPNWRVVDEYTWELTTPSVNALTELLLVNNDLNIIDAKTVAANATEEDPWATQWLASNDAGFGAFTLNEWSPGNRVVLDAFEDYYRGRANVDQVIYQEVPEGSNRRALVETGEVHIAENVPHRELDSLKDSDAVRIWSTPGNRKLRFNVNHTVAPFDNVTVRQALMHAIPQDDLVSTIFVGFGTPGSSPVPSSYPNFDGSHWTYDYDPEKARALLAEAGHEDGFAFTITLDSESDAQRDAATILKTAFEDVGLSVDLNQISSAAYGSELYSRVYDAFFLQEFPILPDAGYALALNYPCGSFLNSTAYCNEEVDELIAAGVSTLDPAERTQIYSDIQRLMAEDAVEANFAEPGWQLVTAPNLSGVSWDTPNIYSLFDIELN